MRRLLIGLLAMAAFTASSVHARAFVQGSAAEYLAGRWALAYRAGRPVSCDFPAANDQWWFDFKQTGGRLLYYEGADLFTPLGGLEVRREGEEIALSALSRDGVRNDIWRLRPTGPDEMVMAGGDPAKPPTILKRCAPAAPPPLEGVSAANISALTPNVTGGQGFPQLKPADTVEALCAGKPAPTKDDGDRGWGQFELIGPEHLWTLFFDVNGLQGYARIDRVRQTAPDTLRLDITSWEEKNGLKAITVRILDDRIEIPEVGMAFARCPTDSPVSAGAGRIR